MDPDETVIAPGGPRRRSSVTHVPPGASVTRMDDGSHRVAEPGAEPSEEALSPDDTEVLTPGGYRRAELVHRVPPGTRVDAGQGRLRHLTPDGGVLADYGVPPQRASGPPLHPRSVSLGRQHAQATRAFGSGWITYASWTNATGTPVSRFATTWTVPPPPATVAEQTVFLFNGIQNSTMIYQPVLQWGVSAAGGGPYWAVASWYADGQKGHSFHSTLQRVKPGDTLVGVITLTEASGPRYSYDCQFTGLAGTLLPVTGVQELTWCIETLEAYEITAATDYPDTPRTSMSAIDVTAGTVHPKITWVPTDLVTDTGQHTVIASDANPGGDVDLYYRAHA